MHRTGIAFLVAAFMVMTVVTATAAPVTTNVPIYQGWNLIGLPSVPLNPDPPAVITVVNPDGALFRWDPVLATLVGWDEFSVDFGNMLIGDGYWLRKTTPGMQNITFQGADVSGDHWLSLPKAGWTLIGYPNLNPSQVNFEDLLVTNGIETKSMTDAYNAGWVSDVGFYFDAQLNTLASVGLPDAFPEKEYIEQGLGYWIRSNVDNLALIVPGN